MITKIDLDHENADFIKIKEYALKHDWLFFMTSAKENIEVDHGFESLTRKAIMKKYGILDESQDTYQDNNFLM